MPRPMRTLALAALAAPIAVVAFAAAHADIGAAVKARHAHMQLYSYNLGILGDMAKGDTEYDAAMAQAAADRLVSLSAVSQEGYYPDGTSSEEVEESRALPVLFEEREKYTALTEDLNAAATEMAAVAGDGADALGPQMQALGGACGACHKVYRAKDD